MPNAEHRMPYTFQMDLRLIGCLLLTLTASAALAQGGMRERKLLDFGWRFHLGNAADPEKDFGYGTGWGLAKAGSADGPANPTFNDSGWREINVPHDWVVELPFVNKDTQMMVSHGFKPVGRDFPETSVGWYRKTFTIPESDKGKRISVEFDGVFRNSIAWINGHQLGREESGYSGFAHDLTDLLNYGGANTLSVRVDATEFEGWFYEGAGIYRHVWLTKTAPVHIARHGIYITTEVDHNTATINIQTTIQNHSETATTVELANKILDPNNKEVATIKTSGETIAPASTQNLTQKVKIANPHLWSLESPQLYHLQTTVATKDTTDQTTTPFGIRTIQFDKDRGFFLNGQHVILQGMCNHQDHAGVGSALPDALQYYRIKQLKAMGCNAYRTSHNPPTPELLDACDQLGMLVMDENRLIGTSNFLLEHFERLIERDRNHPSVILWSIGNEEEEGSTERGERIGRRMVALAHRVDPTRPTTYAGNNGTDYEGINKTVDVRGWNYIMIGDEYPADGPTDKYHRDHPDQPIMGSEEASTLATRGEYKNDPVKGYMSAYDTERPSWGSTAEHWWKYYAARPYLAGAFVWTGFDYRGEPTPYRWPCISSHFGILDTCGFPKDDFYYYQSWWTNQDVLHILPHWNWPGREGQTIPVWVHSNLEEVELFLNGKSLGRKNVERNSHVQWDVPYSPGTLEAHGYRGGREVKVEKIETTGQPAKLVIEADRNEIAANNEDVAVLKISAVDAQGRFVPIADNDITFEITGGEILGVGNGNPSSHEKDKFIPAHADVPTDRWRMVIPAPSSQEFVTPDFNDSQWRTTNVVGEGEQIRNENETAAFRGAVVLPAIAPGMKAILSVGRIDDEGTVYLNGKKLGDTNDWEKSYSFDITQLAHPGRNVIAVLVKNKGGRGGLGRGVVVSLQSPPETPHRKMFNGLAQAIVQGTRTAGVIRVRATSPGLQSAEIEIRCASAPFRGY